LQDGPASVGSKRNIGLHQARYGITLFVDSDCEAEPQLLVEHARVYEGDESGTIGGCMGPTRFVGPDTWLWKTISYSSYVMPFSFPDMMSEVPWGPSSNLSFRTDVLHKIGGFDETFPARPGGEDVDLGLRVVRQGYRIVANRNAAVMHSTDTWDSLQLMRGRLNQWGRAEDYLHERHPERLTFAQPRFLAVCLLAVAVALVQAVATGKVWYLGLPVVWALTSVSVFAVLTARYMDRAAPTALQQALIVLLNQFFESGLIRQGFRRHTGRPIFQTMLYAEGQLVGEWYHSAYWLISHFFAFVVVGAVILCLR
jgi:cellulose synthase/poly-beta-1,6-N-acetylglucosamine synthase-like glycosyltransferase